MASNLDYMYQDLASNLLPYLMRAHDKAGNQLNHSQFNGEDLKLYDVVFDAVSWKKSHNIRSSLYTVIYISKDKKSLLIGRPQTQILKESLYPNDKVSRHDKKYTSANLHLEYVSRDIRRLNFICHGENTDLVVFDREWEPLSMQDYLEEIMNNKHYSISVQVSVISQRDNLNIKDTIDLVKRREAEQALDEELEVTLPPQPDMDDIDEPIRTKSGRQSRKPDRYGS